VANNVWINTLGDNDGNAGANWSLTWVPTAGDTMVFDGNTTHADCTFTVNVGCDALRTDNAYGGTVTQQGDVNLSFSGIAAIDFPLVQNTGINYRINADDFQLGANADISGAGYVYLYQPTDGQGITVFAPGARIRNRRIYVLLGSWNVSLVLAPGTYETELLLTFPGAWTRTCILSSGPCTFGNCTVQAVHTGTFIVNLATNNLAVTFTGDLIIGINSTGGVILDASSNALTVQGDLVNKITGPGTFTAGSQDLDLTGAADQDIDGCGGTWGDVEIDKAAGTITQTGDLTCGAFTGTDGEWDNAGFTVAASGNVDWTSSFDFVSDADAMNACTWTVGGDFTADGQTLNATASWTLTVTGTAVASGVGNVEYSDASGGTEIDASAGPWVDGENNSGWNFRALVSLGPWEANAWNTPYEVGAWR